MIVIYELFMNYSKEAIVNFDFDNHFSYILFIN